MRFAVIVFCGMLFGWTSSGCRQEKAAIDTYQSGFIRISADESFQPVIDEQVRMYEATYPDARIEVHYKTEADCLKDLFFDTATRAVIVTRALTPSEEKWLHDTLSYFPKWNMVAKDAIAVIVHNSNPDSLIHLKDLKSMLAGTYREKEYELVFDGLNATSAYRFIKDSLMQGAEIVNTRIKAGKNSKEVLEYVSNNPKAIGFTGISWIGNPEVKAQREMLKKVKIASLYHEQDSMFVQPEQMNILFNKYPLVRGLYYVVKESYQGLGTGFTNFLRSERGQLIFRRAYLAPMMELEVRNVRITE